jgi:hypothetical protein
MLEGGTVPDMQHAAQACIPAASTSEPACPQLGVTLPFSCLPHRRQHFARTLNPTLSLPPPAALRRPSCSAFGAKALDAKAIMKALPALFAHTQAGVRDRVKEVSVELAAYLGQSVVAGVLLDKMPAAMRKDVDAAVAELPASKKQPSRFTRREAAERAAHGDGEAMDVDGGDGADGGGPTAAEEEPVSACQCRMRAFLRELMLPCDGVALWLSSSRHSLLNVFADRV